MNEFKYLVNNGGRKQIHLRMPAELYQKYSEFISREPNIALCTNRGRSWSQSYNNFMGTSDVELILFQRNLDVSQYY